MEEPHYQVSRDSSVSIGWMYPVFPPVMTGPPLCEPSSAPFGACGYGFTHSVAETDCGWED